MKEGNSSQHFKSRKLIHYSLLSAVLLIQLMIAALFYNEFVQRPRLAFLEKQLKAASAFETQTEHSRPQLVAIQKDFQDYLITGDKEKLTSYFSTIDQLISQIENLNQQKIDLPQIKRIQMAEKQDAKLSKLKIDIDSVSRTAMVAGPKTTFNVPTVKEYDFGKSLDLIQIETQKFSDSTKKKNLFGRLKDAIAGNETVKKDSTVVVYKSGRTVNPQEYKLKADSLLRSVNAYYLTQVQKVRKNVVNRGAGEANTLASFNQFMLYSNNLMIYSNTLLNTYETAINTAKINFEKEYAKERSKKTAIRRSLLAGLFALLFLVSLLSIILTRIAFGYEQKLQEAYQEIDGNLNFKNRILGMLSHEMRAPLKIMGILVGRISKNTTDEQIKEQLNTVRFTSDSLLIQANQILEYTKNPEAQNRLSSEVFFLKKEIDNILISVRPFIETRHNHVVIIENIPRDLQVYSDKTKIYQLFMNILGNANKFTERGEIRVEIDVKDDETENVLLQVEISDTGTGIDLADLDKIFEPYYQGARSNDVENLGAGLGLNLCKELVELFAGTIEVSGEKNLGTLVKFKLHLARPHERT